MCEEDLFVASSILTLRVAFRIGDTFCILRASEDKREASTRSETYARRGAVFDRLILNILYVMLNYLPTILLSSDILSGYSKI